MSRSYTSNTLFSKLYNLGLTDSNPEEYISSVDVIIEQMNVLQQRKGRGSFQLNGDKCTYTQTISLEEHVDLKYLQRKVDEFTSNVMGELGLTTSPLIKETIYIERGWDDDSTSTMELNLVATVLGSGDPLITRYNHALKLHSKLTASKRKRDAATRRAMVISEEKALLAKLKAKYEK